MTATVAARFAEVYERLSMRLPEPSTYVTRARRRAEREGWPPPLAWDNPDDPNEHPHGIRTDGRHDFDPVVVDRIVGGDYRLKATAAEKAAVCARWDELGRSLRSLRQVTGWKVERYYTKEDAA